MSTETNRDWLYDHEVDALIAAVKKNAGKHALRDATLIMLAYKHGLRACEVAALTWNDINMVGRQYTLVIRRAKHRSKDTAVYSHPLVEEEVRAIKRLKGAQQASPYVFTSQKGGALTTRMVHIIVANAGKLAGLPFDVHPHQLRHACGYALANNGVTTRDIQAYLGHRNIQNTVRYTQVAASRFNDLVRVL